MREINNRFRYCFNNIINLFIIWYIKIIFFIVISGFFMNCGYIIFFIYKCKVFNFINYFWFYFMCFFISFCCID